MGGRRAVSEQRIARPRCAEPGCAGLRCDLVGWRASGTFSALVYRASLRVSCATRLLQTEVTTRWMLVRPCHPPPFPLSRRRSVNSQGLRELEALPGLGRYSARAILCLAYGQAVPMIDEGSGRVLRRALGLSVNGPSYASRLLMQAAEEKIPERSAAEFSLGLIDIAARFCRPRMALCSECPLVSGCEHARGSTVASGGASQNGCHRRPPRPTPGPPSGSPALVRPKPGH